MGHDGVRHLVWDWNGTLFDDHVAVVAAINDALALVRLGPIDSDFFRSHYTAITLVSGVVLIAMGTLLYTNELTRLNSEALQVMDDLGINFFSDI